MDPAEHQATLLRIFGTVCAYDNDDAFFVLSPDRFGFGIIGSPASGSDGYFEEQVNALLNLHYPQGAILQISMYASPDIEYPLHHFQVMRHGLTHPLLREITDQRVRFLRELTQRPIGQTSGAKLRSVQLVITVSMKTGTAEPTPAELMELRELRSSFLAALKGMRMKCESLTASTYVRFMETILNHGPNAVWRRSPWAEHDDKTLLCNQLLDSDTDIRVDAKQISLGDYAKVRVLSCKHYPTYVYTGMSMRYLADLMRGTKALRDPILITVNILYPNQDSERGELNRGFAWTTRQTEGQLARYMPVWAKQRDSQRIVLDAVDEGDKIVKAYIGLAVFSDSDERVAQASVEAQGMMRELGFHAMEDRFIVLPLFAQLLPFACESDIAKSLGRYRTVATRHVVPIAPLMGSWRGTGTPLLSLIARDGNLMSLSPNDTDGNMNVVVAAQSGAGKSFLANETVLNYLSVGGRAWIIDKGFSYKPLAGLLDGTYIEFDQATTICLNPFPLVKSWEDESDILSSLIEVMAAPKEGLDDFQTAGLRRVLTQAWANFGAATDIDRLAELFLAEQDSRLVDIGHQLYPWTSAGEYGRFFNGPNTCDLQNQLVVLELQQLTGRPHLQRLVLLQLMYQIQQAMDSLPRDMPKILLIDEAFSLLASNETQKFIVSWYRQLRKFGATAMICTQSINDFFDSNGSEAILENSAHMWLLAQKAESIGLVQKNNRLPMSEGAFRLLESVHTVPGEYSEILVRNAWGMGVGRLVVSDFNKLLYSTSAKDVSAIKAYRDRGLGLVDAINAVMRDRSGAAASAA